MYKIKIYKSVCLFAVASTLVACVPAYRETVSAETTTVNIPNTDQLQTLICQKDKYTLLHYHSSPMVVRVPYGKRISMKLIYFYDNAVCEPTVSFKPKKGVQYKLNIDIQYKKCKAIILRYNPSKKFGFSVDPTMGEAECKDPHPYTFTQW